MDDAPVELALDAHAALGEGPLWDGATNLLWWVDLHARTVHRFDPGSATDDAFPMPTEPGVVCVSTDGRLVVALADGVHIRDTANGDLRRFATVPHDPLAVLLNDGKCDPQGRLWVGSLDRNVAPGAAALYRVDGDATVTTMLSNVTISNGLGWSPGGETMYYTDSATGGIDAFDFDGPKGQLTHRRRLLDIPPDAGAPDGMTVDSEGCLWVALWDGGVVRRYRPDGTLDKIVDVGTPRVTNCTFGGPGLDELYVTTASVGVDEELAARTHAGGLFRLRPGVRGLPSTRFGPLLEGPVSPPG